MTTQPNKLVTIHQNIETLLKSKANALPKSFNQTRFIQNAMTVLQDTPDIETMEPRSVARTILKGAFLGLDFFRRECYAIPYNTNIGTKDKAKWVKSLNFQTDYKGEVKLVKRHNIRPVLNVYAKLVRKGDVYEENIVNGKQSINFSPQPFSTADIIGCFAVVEYRDGGMDYVSLSEEEIIRIRDRYAKQDSKGNFSPAWQNRPEEMYKKTTLRLLCKNMTLEFDTSDADKAFEEGAGFEFTEYEDVKEPIQMPQAIDEKKEKSHDKAPAEDKSEPSLQDEILTNLREEITGMMQKFAQAKKLESYQSIVKKHKAEKLAEVTSIDALQVILDEMKDAVN